MKTLHLSRLLLFVCLTVVSVCVMGQQLRFAKVYSYASPGTTINSLQSDDKGNHIITGYGFAAPGQSTIFFGADSFTNVTNAFIASLDSMGNYNWAQPVGRGNGSSPCGIPKAICDSRNRILVCGIYDYVIPQVGDSILPNANRNVFIARFKTDGSLAWIQTIGSLFIPYGFTEDRYGNLVVVGYNEDSCTVGGTLLTKNVVLAKFDSLGNLIWAKSYTDSHPHYGNVPTGVSTDYNGNIYLTGTYRNNTMFDNITLNLSPYNQNQAGYQGFLAGLDPNGSVLWVRPNGEFSFTVATDSAGNSYTGGITLGYAFFDTISSPLFIETWFINKYDVNGHIKFVLYDTFNNTGGTVNVALDRYGNCYATGYVIDSFSTGGFVINPPSCHFGGSTAFLVALDSSGQILWGKGNCNSRATGYAVDIRGCNVSYAGTYTTHPSSGGPFEIDGVQGQVYTRDTTGFRLDNFFLVSFDTCTYSSVCANGPAVPVINFLGNVLSTSSQATHYQWQLNGNDIVADTTAAIVISRSGVYTLVITDAAGCSATASVNITGVAEREHITDVTLFPNPASQSCSVLLDNTQERTYNALICDMAGRTERDLGAFNGNIFTFSVEPFSQGIYILKIVSGDGATIAKRISVCK